MAQGERRLLTWTLNAGTKAYETDFEQYGNKIYALAIHEFQVEYDGYVYIRRAIPDVHDGETNYGDFTWNNGNFIDNANPAINKIKDPQGQGRSWMGWNFWKSAERGMRRWKHIRHYASFILFGQSKLIKMFDSQKHQDNFIEQVKAVIDNAMNSYHFPGESNRPYIKGIEIDFEGTFSGDEYDYREGDNIKFMNILKRVKNEVCIPRGLILQVNAYAMWGEQTPFYYRFHDYELFANETDKNGKSVIDELQIMTYDFAWNGSAPGASTPLWWFENVATWAEQCFGAKNAKLKMNNVFFGSAGYGHRWGIYHYDRMYGATITYRQFVDWQNGLYKHNTSLGGNTYRWHDQEFLRWAGIEDQESKNQVLQQYVYDYFRAKYAERVIINGSRSATIAEYNGLEYATTYSRIQRSEFTNILADSFEPSSLSHTPNSRGQLREYRELMTTPVTIREKGKAERVKEGIKGYQLYKSKWIPNTIEGIGWTCTKEPSGKVTYTLNLPSAGNYRLIALTSFLWYSQAKLKGTLNGESLTIEPFGDYYPLMFKASHWFDCGNKSFKAGANTITLDGDLGQDGTVIYGFIVCEGFKNNFAGGELTFKANVQPFKKKDGTFSEIPEELSFTSKALRQDPLPLMMWEDRFASYRRQVDSKGNVTYKDVPDITEASNYYTKFQRVTDKRGTGNTLAPDLSYCYDPSNPEYEFGYSRGIWAIKQDDYLGNADNAYAYWGNTSGDGSLLVNYEFRSNMQVECEVRTIRAGEVGIQFGGSSSNDGYKFIADYGNRKIRLTYNGSTIAEDALPSNYYLGERTRLKVIIHNGKGYCYFGYSDTRAFNGRIFDLSRASGGVAGLYARNVEARFYMLKVSTTDKWDLMEKFTVQATIKGQTYSQTFGAVQRKPEYTIDPNFGYLNYSGINEINTRVLEGSSTWEEISLDYEFFINAVPGFQGSADIKVLFDDPGIWYSQIYVVDRAGASITWCGDADSFLDSMNRACNGYGAKGIGLWAMGQEEPRAFETVPEVIAYHDAPPGLYPAPGL